MNSVLTTADFLTIFGMATAVLVGTAGSIWSLSWWLSGRFTSMGNLVYSRTEEIKALFLGKLESHEIHDNNRFNSLTNDLWLLRLRMASKDGLISADEKKDS